MSFFLISPVTVLLIRIQEPVLVFALDPESEFGVDFFLIRDELPYRYLIDYPVLKLTCTPEAKRSKKKGTGIFCLSPLFLCRIRVEKCLDPDPGWENVRFRIRDLG
jgi:hypothetical protein